MQIEEELKQVVTKVNAIYGKFHSLSNDELRAKMQSIENEIVISEKQGETLDKYLPTVFAVVKETARRFTEGDIVVTANEKDQKFADEKEYDFIFIHDRKAVYSNHWEAGGEDLKWQMVHYDEQLMGGYLLHHGYAAEMATGEGKTLVTTLPVILNALSHRGVHVMTTNSYLSIRDYEITRPLYMFFGLSVDCIEKYERSDMRHKKAYDCDITYGANSTFIFDYLFDHLVMNPNKCVQRRLHNYAIIDELDSILVDEAITPHIISNGNLVDNGKLYKEMNLIIKELVELGEEYYTVNTLRKEALFTPKGIKWLSEKTNTPNLFSLNKKYQIKEFNSLSEEKKSNIFNLLHAQNTLNQLLLAYTVYIRDVDYIVEYGRIVIIDQYTGRKKLACRWEHGLHTAVEVKEDLSPQPDSFSSATISIRNYYRLYHKISGMSGTISQVKDELQEEYGLGFYAVPTHKVVVRKDWPIKTFKSKEEKDNAIVALIKENISKCRPTLVGCKTIHHCEDICKLLDTEGLPYNKLNAKEEGDEAIIISKAGIGNIVTVATNMAGRGTDIKPSAEALQNGGLMVIGCDLFDSLRVERQLRGRTGRQGNPGDSVVFASMDEEILQNLSKEDYQRMRSIATTTSNSQNCVIPYFLKAQAKQEKHDCESRKHASIKDDSIAPYRKEYYDLRNDILFNQYSSESLIKKVAINACGDINIVHEHIRNMHGIVCEFISLTLRNDSQSKTIDIPCSDKRHLYTIEISRVDYKDIEYFQSEVFRQTILQVYDKHWQRLMNHLLEDLDEYEVSLLVNKYHDMQDEINNIIYSRLTQSNVVFDNNKGLRNEIIHSSVKHFNSGYKSDYPLEAPCPCKSGKIYKDCHGLRILNRGYRRR